MTARRHGRISLTGGEVTLGQLNKDQLASGISLAYFVGLGLPAGFKGCSRNVCYERKM